eukprot:14969904-Alexandrium_andersonii.AAC.1
MTLSRGRPARLEATGWCHTGVGSCHGLYAGARPHVQRAGQLLSRSLWPVRSERLTHWHFAVQSHLAAP